MTQPNPLCAHRQVQLLASDRAHHAHRHHGDPNAASCLIPTSFACPMFDFFPRSFKPRPVAAIEPPYPPESIFRTYKSLWNARANVNVEVHAIYRWAPPRTDPEPKTNVQPTMMTMILLHFRKMHPEMDNAIQLAESHPFTDTDRDEVSQFARFESFEAAPPTGDSREWTATQKFLHRQKKQIQAIKKAS